MLRAEAVKRAATLDSDKVREQLLKLEMRTMFGDYKVDADGYQLAHKMVTFQWQKEKKVIVWPDDAAPVALEELPRIDAKLGCNLEGIGVGVGDERAMFDLRAPTERRRANALCTDRVDDRAKPLFRCLPTDRGDLFVGECLRAAGAQS